MYPSLRVDPLISVPSPASPYRIKLQAVKPLAKLVRVFLHLETIDVIDHPETTPPDKVRELARRIAERANQGKDVRLTPPTALLVARILIGPRNAADASSQRCATSPIARTGAIARNAS